MSLVRAGGVDGRGTVPGKGTGKSEWLFMALREAAPQTTTYYDVGGWMSYVLDGALLNITLFPDTIAVQPDPLLDVKYFWEERVFADDPFTPDIEPSVPCALAVMIFNEGYGLASDMKIVSGQPEIIDNEKAS